MIKKVGNFLSRPDIFFFACLWLIVLLVLGTLAQRDIGLYQAQLKYFSCFIAWLGPIPTPGGYTTLAVVFFGLSAKLIFKSKFKKQTIGIFVIHLGALVLLMGGFLTGAFSREGNLVISEGQSVGYVSDYHLHELVIIEKTNPNLDQVVAFDKPWLKSGETLQHAQLPFTLRVMEYFENTRFQKRDKPLDGKMHGFAKNFQMASQTKFKENERNVAGLIFELQGVPGQQAGIYGVFENMQIEQTLEINNRSFLILIRRTRRYLPFQIQLLDFEKQMHPATGVARSYKSIVNVIDNNLVQRQVIEMNEPLRYKGYTFYQASFIEGGPTETSVLAVVENMGEWFPYIASIILVIGLLLNMIVRMPKLFQKSKS
jgi:cytochrome c biogenesis protein ResB